MEDFIQKAWKSSDASRFPGPQPVSIERRHFPLLKKQPYVVCEKTDGTRNFLISFEDGVFLVNRAFQSVPVKVRIPKDTLLDGELVTAKNGKVLFMVYDAVLVKGENLCAKPLTARLDAARAIVKGIIKTASAPLEVRVKTMIDLGSPIPDLNSFDYETDGLVFTPVKEPIRMGTHETMFKWKPRERITVDFIIQKGKELLIQDQNQLHYAAEMHLHNCRPDLPDGLVVECGYGHVGWFVEKVRTDKTYPNNKRTFTRTCVNLQEAIQLEEFLGL
jgi:hypothetical protein